MKATGIVRRIDDLGRVVVPKEIRRTLRIREGDPLEIFTDRNGEIILKKYSPIGELSNFAGQCADAITQSTGHIAAITDKDQFIAVSGSLKKELTMKQISKELEALINSRSNIVAAQSDKSFIQISHDRQDIIYEAICPIICAGDVIGSVIIMSKDDNAKFGETELKIGMTAASFLASQMED